ncbi:hypothetical protein HOLleu_43124 [Holothuria leucospilota]|uniref:Ig-like domain-containing protein n=1 Tax=Holothuria leucospilota TaxID=206669 RepID=A0A9Q0YC23_HOLLE|nr:hypothetical protein HOLleu_43124 [Holothuria leucospilota]
MIRTSLGDKLVETEHYMKQNGKLYSTYISTSDAFLYSSGISLLVCKTNNTFGVIEKDQSSVLVQNTNYDLTATPLITTYLAFNSSMELMCNDNEISFLVWKKSLDFGHYYHDVLSAIFIEELTVNVYLHSYAVGKDGSLIVSRVGLEHEGFYRCLYGDGTSDGIENYRVYVYVSPSPPHPMVAGCNKRQHCVLEKLEEGNLSCSVSGIRPEVQLEWKVHDSSETIEFIHQRLIVTENRESFDITLFSQYRVSTDDLPRKVTLICKTAGPGSEIFKEETSVALLISTSKRSYFIMVFVLLLGIDDYISLV